MRGKCNGINKILKKINIVEENGAELFRSYTLCLFASILAQWICWQKGGMTNKVFHSARPLRQINKVVGDERNNSGWNVSFSSFTKEDAYI